MKIMKDSVESVKNCFELNSLLWIYLLIFVSILRLQGTIFMNISKGTESK